MSLRKKGGLGKGDRSLQNRLRRSFPCDEGLKTTRGEREGAGKKETLPGSIMTRPIAWNLGRGRRVYGKRGTMAG